MRRPVALLAVCLLAASNGVAGTGSAAHGRAMTTDSAALVPADRRYQFVDVGGYRLRLLCMGTGRPTVVLEAGEGEGLATWGPVQIGLRRVTRVCAYDRAGEGKSDQGPLDRKSTRLNSSHYSRSRMPSSA